MISVNIYFDKTLRVFTGENFDDVLDYIYFHNISQMRENFFQFPAGAYRYPVALIDLNTPALWIFNHKNEVEYSAPIGIDGKLLCSPETQMEMENYVEERLWINFSSTHTLEAGRGEENRTLSFHIEDHPKSKGSIENILNRMGFAYELGGWDLLNRTSEEISSILYMFMDVEKEDSHQKVEDLISSYWDTEPVTNKDMDFETYCELFES